MTEEHINDDMATASGSICAKHNIMNLGDLDFCNTCMEELIEATKDEPLAKLLFMHLELVQRVELLEGHINEYKNIIDSAKSINTLIKNK